MSGPWDLLQIDVHPRWRNDRVVDWCMKNKIHVTAYAPMSSPGVVASKGKDIPNLLKVGVVHASLSASSLQVLTNRLEAGHNHNLIG